MPRKPRDDEPGRYHHVYSRGIAHRSVLESEHDARYFLSQLARMRHLGLIEVHAYCILVTHFHLLVRSPGARLSYAIGRALNMYVRRFNRARERDGSLFSGRFRSQSVRSEAYWRKLVRYIDQNSRSARISGHADVYPFGSAYHYHRPRGPIWLTRDAVEEEVRADSRSPVYRPEDYEATFGLQVTEGETEFIERRLRMATPVVDPLDDLLLGTGGAARGWLEANARLADGTSPGLVLVSTRTLTSVLRDESAHDAEWQVRLRAYRVSGWRLLHVGLLRQACGASYREIEAIAGVSRSTQTRYLNGHARLLSEDRTYAERAGLVLEQALDAEHGRGRREGNREERHRLLTMESGRNDTAS